MFPKYSSDKLIDKKLSNDMVSQVISLFIVLGVVIYYVVNKEWQYTSPIGFICIVALVMTEEIILQIPFTKNKAIFNSGGPVPLVVYNLALLLAILFYIPLYSPFLFAMAAIIFITVYYRGIFSYFLAATNIIAITFFYTLRYGYPNVPHGKIYPYLLVMISLAFAGIVQRAGSLDNSMRIQLAEASIDIDKERGQLNTLLNGIKDAVVATDANGNIVFFNTGFLKLTGFDKVDTATPFSRVIKLLNNQSSPIDFLSIIDQKLDQQKIENLHIVDKNNMKIFLSIEVSKVNSNLQDYANQGSILLIRDITDEKNLNDQRNEFVAVTSHELRTPITVAEGNISLILNEFEIKNMNKELKHRIHQAHDNILTLGDLVNQLTVLSDIESQNLKLDIGEVDIHELFQELKYQNGYEAQAKGLKFVVDLPNDVGSFYSSQFYVDIILRNILSNAIAYTSHGEIVLSARNSEDRQYILISVKDSGEGMDERQKNKLFTKFYRSEDYTKKHTRGAGLGLYISKKIASLLNIDITFESKLNEGTTFNLKIPINRQ